MRWSFALVLAIAAVALAGCSGKDEGAGQVRLGDGTRISLDLPPEQQPAPDDIRGAVSGVVVNEAIFPIPGAKVSVQDREIEAISDSDGKFVFEAMPPGLYTLIVRMEGYGDGLGTINVRSGQVIKSILQVHRLPIRDPYHTTLKFEEFRGADEFLISSESHERLVAFDFLPRTVILESYWTELQSSASAFRGPLHYEVAGERATSEGVGDSEGSASDFGPNPLRVVFEQSFFAADEYAVRFVVSPDIPFPPEARGTTFLTFFYVEPAPEGWSLVAGDT